MEEKKKKGNGFAITSLVLGIVGLVLVIIIIGGFLGALGLIFGIIAIVQSKGKSKMAIAGTILSVVDIVILGGLVYLATLDVVSPTIEQKKDTFYIGDVIAVEDLVEVIDVDNFGNETKENLKVSIIGKVDTSTAGNKKVKVVALDKNNNETKKEIPIRIIDPNITVYDYIQNNISRKGYYTYTIENYGNGHFSVKYKTKDKDYGIIDFTEMSIKDYSEASSFKFIDIMKFNSNLEITEIHSTSSFLSMVTNEYLDLTSDIAESKIVIQKTHFKDILGKLQDNNINITGKTPEQLKNETVDIREL